MMIAMALALAAGDTTASLAPATQVPQPAIKERLICRTQDRTGSRTGGKRVCYTKDRWREIEGESGDAVRDFQRTGSSLPSNGT